MPHDAIWTPEATTTTAPWFEETCDSHKPYISNALRLATPELYRSMASDDDVAKAFDAFAGSYDTPGEESVEAATHLLNNISIAYHAHFSDSRSAVAFSSGPLTGDRIGVGEQPDWVAYQTTIDVLRAHPDGPVACATLLGAGESSLSADGETHLNWHLNFAKRNRPDLATVRGIRINDDFNCIRLVSHDAAGTSSSGSEPVKTLDVWIAHVLLLYDSLAERDTRFTYRGPGAHAARWSFKADPDSNEREVCFQPVYSLPASKMTLAGYTTCQHPAGELDGATAHGEEVVGVFKTSWQHTKNKTCEGEMLDRAHEGTWLPGLARHWGHWRDEADVPGMTVSYTEPAEPRDPDDPNKEPKQPKTTTRRKEILHLASVGQPLSQCESVCEIFEVAYDAICIIQELNKRGIMHRDLSWGNLLRHVRHDPALSDLFPNKKVAGVDKVPCIRYVLTGDREAEPRALVTDLDLSVPFAQDVSKAYKGPPDIAGTVMFRSLERDPKTRTARSRSSNDVLAALKTQLRKVEDDKELFRRAFPGRRDGFVGFLEGVFNAEMNRAPGNPLPAPRNRGHHPRHEVESLFWILYYALARACPLGVEPLDETDGAMSRFVNAMFNSTQDPLGRAKYFAVERLKKVLHPKLARFVPLLENMVVYLSLPWDQYHRANVKTDIELYHAHIAFKRLLLEEIRVLKENPKLDVLLDTTQPRIRNLWCDDPLPTSGRTPLAIEQTGSATAGECTTGETSTTLLPADEPARDAPTTGANTSKRKRSDDDDDSGEEDGAAAAKRSKDDSAPRITVSALAGMFRTDRKLWIGRGDRGALLGPEQRSRTAGGFIRVPESDEDQGQPLLKDEPDNDCEEPEATISPAVQAVLEDESDNDWEEREGWSRPAAAVRPPYSEEA